MAPHSVQSVRVVCALKMHLSLYKPGPAHDKYQSGSILEYMFQQYVVSGLGKGWEGCISVNMIVWQSNISSTKSEVLTLSFKVDNPVHCIVLNYYRCIIMILFELLNQSKCMWIPCSKRSTFQQWIGQSQVVGRMETRLIRSEVHAMSIPAFTRCTFAVELNNKLTQL